jgi:hypothetical protein
MNQDLSNARAGLKSTGKSPKSLSSAPTKTAGRAELAAPLLDGNEKESSGPPTSAYRPPPPVGGPSIFVDAQQTLRDVGDKISHSGFASAFIDDANLPVDNTIGTCEGAVFWLFAIGVILIIAGVVMCLIQDSIVVIVGITALGLGFFLMLGGIAYQQVKRRSQ